MLNLIRMAFKAESYQIVGPPWVAANMLPGPDMFFVEARFPEGTTEDQFRMMLQAMLAERFGLTLHHEKRELNVFALVVAPAGSKLKAARPAGDSGEQAKTVSGRRGVFHASATAIQGLIDRLGSEAGRPIVDMTHLDGVYDIELEWQPAGRTLPDASSALPDLFGALALQLGLRLVPQKAPFDMLVIDRINRIPTEN
jgi:uncharacterized protein (TIGR03435 family)